jgi:hypothetical protein
MPRISSIFAVTRHCLLSSALIAASVAGSAGAANAATLYDGYWNVSIMTHRGSCDRVTSLSVSIRDGRIDGAGGVLTGSVGSNGALRALLGGGDSRGSASGRLAAAGRGGGSWSGVRSGGSCSGRWSAQKM